MSSLKKQWRDKHTFYDFYETFHIEIIILKMNFYCDPCNGTTGGLKIPP